MTLPTDIDGICQRPTAWYRGIRSAAPGEPDEYDVDMSYGDDRPDGEGWIPLYRLPPPAPIAPQPIDAEGQEKRPCDRCGGNGRLTIYDYAPNRGQIGIPIGDEPCPDCTDEGQEKQP